MGFKRTSEGRVFFKSNEDDAVFEEAEPSAKSTKSEPGNDPVPSTFKTEQTQVQILLLLKTLNTKLQDSQEERLELKEELAKYRSEIKKIEDAASKSEKTYIDLEQKVAAKQNETIKKASRVEETMKETVKELEKARNLVESLEGKSEDNDETLKALKAEITKRKKQEEELLKLHQKLEKTQQEQAEKLTDGTSAYVALTKRVTDAEARQEALDNKIEEATTEFLKLDRKINKAIEDRSRLLRKMERMEESIQDTKDALNAKAMVLLTSQGQFSAVDYAKIEDGTIPPEALLNAPQKQSAPAQSWWNRPFQLQAASMLAIIIIGLILGWMISEIRKPTYIIGQTSDTSQFIPAPNRTATLQDKSEPEPVSLADIEPSSASQESPSSANFNVTPEDVEIVALEHDTQTGTDEPTPSVEISPEDPSTDPQDPIAKEQIDIEDEESLLAAFESNPDALAEKLNEIEPASLTEGDMSEPKAVIDNQGSENQEAVAAPVDLSLRNRMEPDPDLPPNEKKIEDQAYSGVPEAQHDLGAIYVAGYGNVPQNLERAVFWFGEASDSGIANAKYNLGVLYHQGMGVGKNLEKALDLYKEAADLGHPEAQYNLGIAYVGGIGFEYDPVKAAGYFRNAANEGIMEAAYNLGLIYENGLLGENSKPEEALKWYKQAADQGSPEAKAALEELAQSLGISINEVNRIVDAMNATSPEQTTTKTSSAASTDPAVSRQNLVSAIQYELMKRGLYPGPVDGALGPLTSDAIRTYQSTANYKTVDGKPSSELLDYLRKSGVEQGSGE